jgi:flagellar biosynthesis GTPase FlhF
MDLRTYHAWTLQEALRLVRQDLGPEAAVLYTRRTAVGVWGWFGMRKFEVVAALGAEVPSRFPPLGSSESPRAAVDHAAIQPAELEDYRARLRLRLKELASQGQQAAELIPQAQ